MYYLPNTPKHRRPMLRLVRTPGKAATAEIKKAGSNRESQPNPVCHRQDSSALMGGSERHKRESTTPHFLGSRCGWDVDWGKNGRVMRRSSPQENRANAGSCSHSGLLSHRLTACNTSGSLPRFLGIFQQPAFWSIALVLAPDQVVMFSCSTA